MTRYFTRPKTTKPRADLYYDDEPLFLPNLSVPDHEAADTGILDKHGDAIMRAPNPMGFIWD